MNTSTYKAGGSAFQRFLRHDRRLIAVLFPTFRNNRGSARATMCDDGKGATR
jgi:hypothetical protein